MLDVTAINGHVPQQLRAVINDLRRNETSATTIHVQPALGTYSMLDFYDERFPSTREDSPRIARIRYEAGNFILRSSRIKNRKYGGGSGGYHEFMTKDARKMQKLLRQYVYPLTIAEIIDSTEAVSDKYDTWVARPERDMGPIMGSMSWTAKQAVLEEMCHMRTIGVNQFKTPLFQKIFDEMLPLHDEHKRRQALKAEHVHVYVESDGKVSVTKSKGPLEWDTIKYPSVEQVPEDIQQQICVLKLVDKGKYVPEVGQRMTDDIYWIHLFTTP